MRKLLQRLRDKQALTALLVLCGAIAFYMLLAHLPEVWRFFLGIVAILQPLLAAAVIAYVLHPVVSFFEHTLFRKMKKRRAAHGLATFLTLLCAAGLVVLLSVTLVPQLVSSVAMLLDSFNTYFEAFRDTVTSLANQLPTLELDINEVLSSWEEILQSMVDWAVANAGNILGGAVRIGNGMVNFAVTVILAVYMLLDIQSLQRSTKRLFRSCLQEPAYARALELAHRSNRIFLCFIRDNLLDSLIVGVANFLFMVILDMPYPLLISVIVGVTNFIPTFGPFIGAIPSLIIILLVRPLDALWFLLWTLVLQFTDGNILKPNLFKGPTGLRPLWVLASIIIGGRLFGIVGMILGIPLLSIVSSILEENISKRLAKRGYDDNGDPVETQQVEKEGQA